MKSKPEKWLPHPWHGLSAGPDPPHTVHAYIEITPFDLVKYEIDKTTGYLMIDRPQRTSSLPPCLYGFIPQTYCGGKVAALTHHAKEGDGDALDICVLTERPVRRIGMFVTARTVGVLRATDEGLSDDKIIAVLCNDPFWTDVQDIDQLPSVVVERLRHYFSTYKLVPGESNLMKIQGVEGKEEATQIIQNSLTDYEELWDDGSA